MSEHFFGLGSGKIKASARQAADVIAEKHGASLSNPTMPGEGPRYWFACPNRGNPFDDRTAAAVIADLTSAGLWPLPVR